MGSTAFRKEYLKKYLCPVCANNNFTYHCKYQKYYYKNEIEIVRVKCLVCGSTHALIPEFSLPGTSIGMSEANEYMVLRTNGVSQRKASEVFIRCGMSHKYGIAFEKKVMSALQKAIAIFPDDTDVLHNPLLLFQPQIEFAGNVILKTNYLFLERGYNPLFLSRSNILRIREIKTGIILPLNKGAIWSGKLKIDSS
jgi:hypothetical protein